MALNNGTEYFYSIYFYDESGNYIRLDDSAIPNGDTLLMQPTMIDLVAGDSQMTLTWNKVTVGGVDAESYKVYYGFAPDNLAFVKEVFVTDVGFDPENPATVLTDNVFNNSMYWVTVTSVIGGVESLQASPMLTAVPAVTTGVPQPQNVYAIAGDAAFRVKWDANPAVTKWNIYYGDDPLVLTTLKEVLAAEVLIDGVDGMAYHDIFHVDGVTPVVNDTLYYIKMQAEIAEIGPFSETVTVMPQEGIIGFPSENMYLYAPSFAETIIGVPLQDESAGVLDGLTTTLDSSYVILYDASFKTYIPGIGSLGNTPVQGATAYVVGPSNLAGENIIITGDEWSNDTTSL